MWEAFQDGEKLGTGENLAPWHPIKPGGVLILGQEQVGAGRCKMGALLGCQEQRLVIQEARGPACRLSPQALSSCLPAGPGCCRMRAGLGPCPALPGRDQVGVVGSEKS